MAYEAGESADPYALLDWYLSAELVIRDLDACHVVADAMLCGSATPNLVAAGALNAFTNEIELWLVTHPCPEPLNGDDMAEIVHTYGDRGTHRRGRRRSSPPRNR